MRRAILTSAYATPAILLIAGVAYARTFDCNGGDCKGTNRADTTNGSPQDDKMIALNGGDPPTAWAAGTRSRARPEGIGSSAARARTGSMAARETTSPEAGPTAKTTTTPEMS